MGLAKNTVSWVFPERFPTFMGLRKPKEERMGPPDEAKVRLLGKPTGILSDRISRVFLLFTPGAHGGPTGPMGLFPRFGSRVRGLFFLRLQGLYMPLGMFTPAVPKWFRP